MPLKLFDRSPLMQASKSHLELGQTRRNPDTTGWCEWNYLFHYAILEQQRQGPQAMQQCSTAIFVSVSLCLGAAYGCSVVTLGSKPCLTMSSFRTGSKDRLCSRRSTAMSSTGSLSKAMRAMRRPMTSQAAIWSLFSW